MTDAERARLVEPRVVEHAAAPVAWQVAYDRLLARLAALEAVAEAAHTLDRVATWSALNRPEVAPLRAALRALDGTEGP